MGKKLVILTILILFLSLNVKINTIAIAQGATFVKVDPSLIEFYTNATGQQFTIAVKIVDIVNLYGLDIQLKWNTTYLEYVSHSVRVPKDDYPDGVLWKPIFHLKDDVNTTAGTYWIAKASTWPAPTFNGSGTVFNMTFRVKYHPALSTVNTTLELYSTELAAYGGDPIPHYRQHGEVILHALAAYHDVAVVGVHPWKTIVGQGYPMQINVTVANQGGYTETFNVTLYANTTTIETKQITLTSLNSTTITYTWNTTGFAKGNYTLWAYAEPVQGETDTTDNTFIDGWVYVGIPGDVNGDGIVEGLDISKLARAFGAYPGHPKWDANLDINNDNFIDGIDISRAARNYGKTDP